MSTQDRAFSSLFVIVTSLAAIALLVVGFEGVYVLVNLRAADEALQAAALAASEAVDVVGEAEYRVLRLREADGPSGPSALSAAQSQIEARGLADRLVLEGAVLFDAGLWLSGSLHLPTIAGRWVGIEQYTYALAATAPVAP